MSKAHSPVREALPSTALDTFLAISRSYFTCAERITAVNLATARQTLTDCARASDIALGTADARSEPTAPLTHTVERSFEYTRTVYEIIADTQEQVSQMMTRELSDLQDRLANPDSWRTAFGIFTTGTSWPFAALPSRSEPGAEPPATEAAPATRKAA